MRSFRYPSQGGWRQRGQAHGETFAGEIRGLAALRTTLCRQVGGFDSEADVLALAAEHLPVLEAFDGDRHQELVGIAEGSGASAAAIVVLNHYTDLRDLGGAGGEGVTGSDGCTVIWSRTPSGPILAQTWDMHASAMPYVIALEIPEHDTGERRSPRMTLLSVTGCLGMAGLSSTGIGVAINNLHSSDARIGVVWPALVRRALASASASAARDLIVAAPLGSGHHYVVADADEVFGIETSGALRRVIFAGEDELYVHTNHCIDDEVAAASRVPAGSTTHDRLTSATADAMASPITSADDAFRRLGSQDGYPRSVCTNMSTADKPHAAATCGALAIDFAGERLLACAGFPNAARPRTFAVERLTNTV